MLWTLGLQQNTSSQHQSNCVSFVSAIVFNFTTLGAVGKQGPSSNMVYPGNQMQNVTIHNGIQHWRVPISGKYEIVLHGASGISSI